MLWLLKGPVSIARQLRRHVEAGLETAAKVAAQSSQAPFEEMMQERGVSVDHSTINRWVLKYSLQREAACHRRKRPVWVSWRMDETYIIVRRRPG
jgi:transposase-like protein